MFVACQTSARYKRQVCDGNHEQVQKKEILQLKMFKAPVQWGPLVSSLPRTWTRSGRHFVTTTDDLFTGGFPKGEGGLRFVLKKIWLFKTTELIYSLEEKRNACLKLQVCISCREDVVGDVVDDHHWENV